MQCEECVYLGTKCPECKEIELSDVKRRLRGKRYWRKCFTAVTRTRCPRCDCCTNLQLAAFYHNCHPDMYVGHKLTAAQGGKHCVKNLKYFVKQSLTKK